MPRPTSPYAQQAPVAPKAQRAKSRAGEKCRVTGVATAKSSTTELRITRGITGRNRTCVAPSEVTLRAHCPPRPSIALKNGRARATQTT